MRLSEALAIIAKRQFRRPGGGLMKTKIVSIALCVVAIAAVAQPSAKEAAELARIKAEAAKIEDQKKVADQRKAEEERRKNEAIAKDAAKNFDETQKKEKKEK